MHVCVCVCVCVVCVCVCVCVCVELEVKHVMSTDKLKPSYPCLCLTYLLCVCVLYVRPRV